MDGTGNHCAEQMKLDSEKQNPHAFFYILNLNIKLCVCVCVCVCLMISTEAPNIRDGFITELASLSVSTHFPFNF